MSDLNQNAVPGAVNPVETPVPTPAAQAAPVPPAAEAPKAKAAPRPLNPYAAKVAAAKAPPADPRIAALEASNAEHLSTLSSYADAELANAPEGLRDAVIELAGDDPAKRLKFLATLRNKGFGSPALTPGATTGAGASAKSAGQAPKPAPKAAPAQSPEAQTLAQYRHLQSKGASLMAAQFRSKNAAAIAKAEAAEDAH